MIFVAYDVTRLFLGTISRTPRGIDRIDLILARHFFDLYPDRTVGILPTPWGVRVQDAVRVRRGLDRLERYWAEDITVTEDLAFAWVRARLLGQPVGAAPFRSQMTLLHKARRLLGLIRAAGFSFGQSAQRVLPKGAVYLNVGQISLALSFLYRWLDHRPDIWAAFMLHDVIPLEEPGLVAPSSVRFHEQILKTTVRHAGGLIVSTRAAGDAVRAALAVRGRGAMPTLSALLPLHRSFDSPAVADQALAGVSYFVVCGAIEPRKNLELLLQVWERLVQHLGPATPHLVMVGTPNHEGDRILAAFAGSSATRPFIHTVAGLSTSALKSLIVGARALMMPSLAEGFGLPVLEARALGCPVIASDILAHREVTDTGVTFLPARDVGAWTDAVLAARTGGPRPAPLPQAVLQADRDAFVARITVFLATRGAQV